MSRIRCSLLYSTLAGHVVRWYAMTTQSELFANVGELGREERRDGRLYENAVVPPLDAEVLTGRFLDLVAEGQKRPGVSRVILRGLVSPTVVERILRSDSPLLSNIEVLADTTEFGHPGALVYLAQNAPDRQRPHTPLDVMIAETDKLCSVRTPLERVTGLARDGYRFIGGLEDRLLPEVQTLWGETFGWRPQQLAALAARLRTEWAGAPASRRVWFAGVLHGDKLVTTALAERLDIPGYDGYTLGLVEATEARTHPEYQRRGLYAGALSMLQSQVLESFARASSRPFIFGECNYTARSDRPAYAAGRRIPERLVQGRRIAQILVQNVVDRDGILGPDGEPLVPSESYRDYNFLYLPGSSIREFYGADTRAKLLAMLDCNA